MTMTCRTLALLLLTALVMPAPSAAQDGSPPPDSAPPLPLVGEISVRLNGYLGREETLVNDLELRVQGLSMRTAADGTFHLADMSAHGHSAGGTGRITFDDPAGNWVRFALGRQYLRLEVVWVGEARGDAIVLYPVQCELNADESGGCFAQLQNNRDWEGRLRGLYNLAPLPQPARPTPAAAPAAPEPARPAVPTAMPEPVVVPLTPPADGVQDFETIEEPIAPSPAQPAAAPVPAAPARPVPPPTNVPPPGELRVIEPLR
jgi:hypothetical protein